jgi:group I intron endonuclease
MKRKEIYHIYGIYAITNKLTGVSYIGQTSKNFGDRRDCNYAKLRHNNHDNVRLQTDWNKCGEDNFLFEILEIIENKDVIDDREKFWISKYKDKNKAFNILIGGKGSVGIKLSEETKIKIGEKNKVNMIGRKASEYTKNKMSNSHKGYKPTLESIEKMRLKKIGIKMSDNFKLKNSISHSGERCAFSKYNIQQILKAREIYDNECKDYKYISDRTGINVKNLSNIIKRKRWKYI